MTPQDAEIRLKQVKELPPPLSNADRKKNNRVMLAIYDRLEVIDHNGRIATEVAASAHNKACAVEKKQSNNEAFIKGVAAVGMVLIAVVGWFCQVVWQHITGK